MSLVSGIEKLVENLSLTINISPSFNKINQTTNIINNSLKQQGVDIEPHIQELNSSISEINNDFKALINVEEEISFWKVVHEEFSELQNQLSSFFELGGELRRENFAVLHQVISTWQPHIKSVERNPILKAIENININVISIIEKRNKEKEPSQTQLEKLENKFNKNFINSYIKSASAYNELFDKMMDTRIGYKKVVDDISCELQKGIQKIDKEKIGILSGLLEESVSKISRYANAILINLLTMLDISFIKLKESLIK